MKTELCTNPFNQPNMQMRSFNLLILCGMLLLFSCNRKSIVQQVEAPSPNGIWEQEGYGFIIEIQDSLVRTYDICEVDCHFSFEEKLVDLGAIKDVSSASLIFQDGLNVYKYKKLKQLPNACLKKDTLFLNNPVHNFETLWHTIDEHYCYFETRNIDWDAYYQKYRNRLTEQSSDMELYTVLKEMLDEMEDGHVKISATKAINKAYKEKQKEANPQKEKKGTFHFFQLAQEIADQNLKDKHTYNKGAVNWGMVDEETLYIQVNLMFLLADYNLSNDLDLGEYFDKYFEIANARPYQSQDEVAGIQKVMSEILSNTTAKNCILDARFNPGGKDEASLNIMGHFTKTPKQIATKKVRLGASYSPLLRIDMACEQPYFAGDLYVLTSHLTASAGETLVLCALEMPHATIIGANTEGIFSDMLDKTLPNGWAYSLSNEVFLDNKGTNYESIGIPADVKIDYPRDNVALYYHLKKELDNKKDAAIDAAIRLIKEQ